MAQNDVLDLFYSAMYTALLMAGPLLLASIIIGLVIAIFQAATQIHEQTLTFVPKVLVIALLLLVLGSSMITWMQELFSLIFEKIAGL